jgi:hypothetical protein
MEDLMADRPAVHIRLPQRAEAVSGEEQRPGEAVPEQATPDPRTVSQDPVAKDDALKIEGQNDNA